MPRTQQRSVRRSGGVARQSPPASSIDLSLLTGLFGFSIRIAQVYVFEHFHRQLWRRHHLHPGALAVLIAVRENPGVRPGALADALVVKRPNMTKLLDSLAKRGWIERGVQSTDGRGVSLVLTRHGHRKLTRIIQEALAMDQDLTASLTARERETVLTLLQKLTSHLQRTREHPRRAAAL
jgi:DNA-binding MarR family transcriptional regulator